MAPKTPIAELIHSVKYRAEGETFEQAVERQASSLADSDKHYDALLPILHDQRFLAAGRVQAAIGSGRNVTAYNCFVSGTIQDSFTDGAGSIMDRAKEAATTLRMGGGIGYDFSTLRPNGAEIKKLGSFSNGPVAFMDIFQSTCATVASAGHRRGAQMGVMRVDHPDIQRFIAAKRATPTTQVLWDIYNEMPDDDPRKASTYMALQATVPLRAFNISVGITDEFMHALSNDGDFNLVFEDKVYETVKARDLWKQIMDSTWEWAEPGVLFIDRINKMNNLYYCETIAATNPCGEQPLPPYGACLLGSINLVKYLVIDELGTWFDYDQLYDDIPHIVRAMDNVIDQAKYPLPEQEAEAKSKRRMGIGVTAVANVVETLGMAYGSPEAVEWLEDVLSGITNECYMSSSLIAAEKGSFPLYDAEKYIAGAFVQKLYPEVIESIMENGIRNSHLTSIAPTGTISISADNVSSGIEPVFGKYSKRPIDLPGHEGEVFEFSDYAFREFGTEPRDFTQVTAQEHVSMLCAAQKWVDSSVSKTCNVPGDMPREDFENLYIQAYLGGAKGCTTYTMGGSKASLIQKDEEKTESPTACEFDPKTGLRSCE